MGALKMFLEICLYNFHMFHIPYFRIQLLKQECTMSEAIVSSPLSNDGLIDYLKGSKDVIQNWQILDQGVTPKEVWIQMRLKELARGIKENIDRGNYNEPLIVDWCEELAELLQNTVGEI
jgi:hypothetical protein